jgi:hypothetical protein
VISPDVEVQEDNMEATATAPDGVLALEDLGSGIDNSAMEPDKATSFDNFEFSTEPKKFTNPMFAIVSGAGAQETAQAEMGGSSFTSASSTAHICFYAFV